MLPDPYIFGLPMTAWLGIIIFLLLIFQILSGKNIIKVPLWVHIKLLPIILVVLILLHMWYGFQLVMK